MIYFKTFLRLFFVIAAYLSVNSYTYAQGESYYLRSSIQIGENISSTNLFPTLCSTTDLTTQYSFTAVSVLSASGGKTVQINAKKPNGQLVWQQNFNLDSSGDTYCSAITVDGNQNIYITGSGYNGSSYDLFIAKFSSNGTLSWQQTFDGVGQSYDVGTALTIASDGSVYVTGGTMQSSLNMDVIIRKYSTNGVLQWSKTWGSPVWSDIAKSVSITNGQLVISGITQKNASVWEYVFIDLALNNGSILAQNETNLGGTSIDQATSFTQDGNGNYYICGGIGSSTDGMDIKTIKLDGQFNIVWVSVWNSSDSQNDSANDVAVDGDGNVYVAGYTSKNNQKDALLIKYNSSGQVVWSQTLFVNKGDDVLNAVLLNQDNQPFVVGYQAVGESRDLVAALLNNGDGAVIWSDEYNGDANGYDEAFTVVTNNQGDFLVQGWTNGVTPQSGKLLEIKYTKHRLILPPNDNVGALFVENRGQLLNTNLQPEPSVRFYSTQTYPNVFLTDNSVSYVLSDVHEDNLAPDYLDRIQMSFPIVNNLRPGLAEGLDESEAYHNYYLGHLAGGRERVPLLGKALQPNLFPNIDAIYGIGDDGLFIRFVCKAGSDPSLIEMKFNGQSNLQILANGDLQLSSSLEPVLLPKPTAFFLNANGVETAAPWSPGYVNSGNIVKISVGPVPADQTLVIKIGRGREDAPCTQYWSTYFGDSNKEVALGNDVNEDNHDMYFTGNTSSTFFPASAGAFQDQLKGITDAYLACFKQQDIIRWITFHGGTEPSGLTETGYAVKYNPVNQAVYYVGRTTANDFPLETSSGYNDTSAPSYGTSPVKSRGFIGKFALDGGIIWASFIGDKSTNEESVMNLEITSKGNVVVGGYSSYTQSTTDFPFTPGSGYQHTFGNPFIIELDPDNTLLWATRLANSGDAENGVTDIAEGSDGSLWVYGRIYKDEDMDDIPFGPGSESFHGGLSDAFLMRFDGGRELLWASFIGGSAEEYASSIVAVPDGGVFISGTTTSTDFPTFAVGDPSDITRNNTAHSGGNNIYLTKYRDDYTLEWGRFFSSSNQGTSIFKNLTTSRFSVGNSLSLGNNGKLLLTGTGNNGFAPLVSKTIGFCSNNIFYSTAKQIDAIVVVMDLDFFVDFSTFWGGTSNEFGWTISSGYNPEKQLDFIIFGGQTNSGNATGSHIPLCKESPDNLNPYFKIALNGVEDGFISKIYIQECEIVNTLEKAPTGLEWQILPNPANNQISILLPDGYSHEYVCSIFDVVGSLQKSIILSGNTTTVDIDQLPMGVYFIQLAIGPYATQTKILIKQ